MKRKFNIEVAVLRFTFLLQVLFIMLQAWFQLFPNWWIAFLPLIIVCGFIGLMVAIIIALNPKEYGNF